MRHAVTNDRKSKKNEKAGTSGRLFSVGSRLNEVPESTSRCEERKYIPRGNFRAQFVACTLLISTAGFGNLRVSHDDNSTSSKLLRERPPAHPQTWPTPVRPQNWPIIPHNIFILLLLPATASSATQATTLPSSSFRSLDCTRSEGLREQVDDAIARNGIRESTDVVPRERSNPRRKRRRCSTCA